MTKKKVFWSIFALLLVVILAAGAVLCVPNFHGGNASIGGEIMTDTTKTPQEYLSIINNYTIQNSQLKAELSSIQAELDKEVAEYKAEILELQTEINELTEEDAEIIAEKNARIETLRDYISVLEKEQTEKNLEYEQEIEKLNNIIASYETKVIETIKIPEGFVFTSLGFNVIDSDSFVFYSKSHSCNLYYYDFNTKITVTIPIKSTSFNCFYKTDNLLFFRASSFLYLFDFSTQNITLLGPSMSYLSYIEDVDIVYMFDYYSGFAIFNKATNEFENSLSTYNETTSLPCVFNIDNYVLYGGTIYASGTYCFVISLFNKETTEYITLVENLNYQATYINYINNELLCWSTPNLYQIDIKTKTAKLIGEITSSNSIYCKNFFNINNKLVCFTRDGVWCYTNNEIVNLSTANLSTYNLLFITISQDIYYIGDLFISGGSSYCPLYKLDLEKLTFEKLISDSVVYDYYEINNYEILLLWNRYCFIDKITGAIELSSTESGGANDSKSIKVIECGDFIVFYKSNNTPYLYFFDKVNNVYGRLESKLRDPLEVVYKNNLLYVLTTTKLYSLSLSDPTVYLTDLTVDGTLSSLKQGIIYSNVGTLNGSSLYVKYLIKEDGTLVKSEFVLI